MGIRHPASVTAFRSHNKYYVKLFGIGPETQKLDFLPMFKQCRICLICYYAKNTYFSQVVELRESYTKRARPLI